ncbi:MAG: rhomboid family intramembrane serine protease, partial [Candidatus Brocadiales bacterium]
MFLPYRDKNPSGTFPFVTIAIIVVNSIVFIYELSLGYHLEGFIYEYGIVPARVIHFFSVPSGNIKPVFLPFFTSMFLHAGFLHLIGNMWYLWIFGDNIEDRLGHLKFLGFYLASGVGASIIFLLFGSESLVPCIGASGAIAGVLGAYMITFPKAKIMTLIVLFVFFWRSIELPAIVVLGFWFVIQFFNGIATPSVTGGGTAWWAHIGGFILGIVL